MNGDVHGLSDFAQENPEVDAYLRGLRAEVASRRSGLTASASTR